MRRFSLGIWIMALLLTSASAAVAEQAKATKAKAATASSTPVNINTATAAQLDALPGVGAKTAQLIVEQRQKSGGFKKIEDLREARLRGL
jgi:competence protein ComEA